DIVVGIAVAVLLASTLLTPAEVLGVLSNSAPITIACMFVLSAALERTGCVERLGSILARIGGTSPTRMLFALLLTAMLLSTFINNTPVVAILTPVAVTLAARQQGLETADPAVLCHHSGRQHDHDRHFNQYPGGRRGASAGAGPFRHVRDFPGRRHLCGHRPDLHHAVRQTPAS